MKKIILLLLAPFILQYATGCICNVDVQYAAYSRINIGLQHIDNSGLDLLYYNEIDSVPKSAYGIRLQQTLELMAYQSFNNYNLFNSAMATSKDCPEPLQYLPLDSIVSVKFVSQMYFNDTHPVGSDVSKYFYQYKWPHYQSIENYLSKPNEIIFDAAQDSLVVDFLLMTAPQNQGIYSFAVVITLSDGRVFTANTLPTKLY